MDAESAVEGWARSGNYVDVILVRMARDSSSALESAVIAENVRILSAGSSAVPMAGEQTTAHAPSTVTLLTSQEDALKIKTAVNLGKLTFALRGTGDRSPTIARLANQHALLNAPQARTAEPYKGKAKGPDGKLYVLDSHSQWLRASANAIAQTSGPAEQHQ